MLVTMGNYEMLKHIERTTAADSGFPKGAPTYSNIYTACICFPVSFGFTFVKFSRKSCIALGPIQV